MNEQKIAPGLLSAFEDLASGGLSQGHLSTMGLVTAPARPARAVVFLHCPDAADLGDLSSMAVTVNQPSGSVRTAFVPIGSLDALSDDERVRRIVPARYLRTLMDVAAAKTGLADHRSRTGLSGLGVVVGVVDTGIDPGHPAFAGRIARVWDQTLHGPGVAEGGYGRELTGTALSQTRDSNGHGTHVAGIAAGGEEPFRGVAPASDLVIVKTDLMDAHIADAVRYVFRVASDLGRPAVVNLSLGGHWDPHDGTDSLSQVVDAESGPGRIVCVAAGNEGEENIHAAKTVPASRFRSIRFHVPSSSGSGAIRFVVINAWYAGSDEIEVSVRTPGGFVTPWQGPIDTGSPTRTSALPDSLVRVTTPRQDPFNGDRNVLVEIQHPFSGPVASGTWRLRLRGRAVPGEGRVDLWILDSRGRGDCVFAGTSVEEAVKVGSPGAASECVTVASYTTRVQWTDAGGVPRALGLDLDDISDFSSPGPRRDEVRKPDVAAPGAMIASALSAASAVEPAWVIAPGYRMNAGTSMASPFVAGLVARLLEQDPTLEPGQVKARLKAASLLPVRPGDTWDPKWGHGLIDARKL